MEKKLTREVLNIVLKKFVSGDFEIVNFKVKPFEDKEREYFKSESVLEISAKISRNISRFRFFLKKFLAKHPAFNELLVSIHASEREVFFYESLLPRLSKSLKDFKIDLAPSYLLGKVNDFMILEDLSLKFYGLAKKTNLYLLDRFHVCLGLKAMAKLHAASFSYEDDMKTAGTGLFTEEELLLQEPLWRKEEESLGYKQFLAGIKGIKTLLANLQQLDTLDDSLIQKIDDLAKRFLEIIKPQTKFRNVICHGDLRTKNVLFKYEGTLPIDCVLLNWGYCRYFPPAYDVLIFIFFTTNQLFRQHYFTYLIQYYHDCLRNELIKQDKHVEEFLSFEEFQQSINYFMPMIKLRTVLHLQNFGAKEGFYKIIQKDESAYRQFLYEDQSSFLLDVIEKDPIFKVMIIEALEELLDTLNDSRVSRENCYEILERRLDTTVYDLNEFFLNPTIDDESKVELTLSVCLDNKEGTNDEYKYELECDENYSIKILNQVQ